VNQHFLTGGRLIKHGGWRGLLLMGVLLSLTACGLFGNDPILGDTADLDGDVWNELHKVLTETWPMERNKNMRMGIKMLAVDSGYNTQTVYSWVRKYPANRVVAVKGQDNLNLVHGLPKTADVNTRGKNIKRGLRVWPVGHGVVKTELYGWLKQPQAVDEAMEPYGFCYFPEYDSEYFKMLTAEGFIYKIVKGYKKGEWQKTRERNEALDCRVYARAAASILGIDRYNDETWENLENEVFQPTIENTPKTKPKKKREKEGWL